MSAVFHQSEFEAEGRSGCSKTGLPPAVVWADETSVAKYNLLERDRVMGIDGSSAKVMACTGKVRELVELDRARLLNSTCAADGTECDRNGLRTTTCPEGVDMA